MPQPTIFSYFPYESDTQPTDTRTRKRIAASEATISELQSQVSTELEILARLRAAIAPVRNLPAELLLEIFVVVLKVGTDRDPDGRCMKGEIRQRHALTQVCARWRRVIHTSPRLWAVGMDVILHESQTTIGHLVLVKRWLDRSAPLPIPISLSAVSLSGDRHPLTKSAMHVLCSVASRWTEAKFRVASISCLKCVPKESLTSLTTLELLEASNDYYFDPAKIKVFSDVPNLRTLDLNIRQPTRIPMPWGQLTSLTLAATPFACLEILRRCTCLVTAQFITDGWEFLPDMSARSMTTIVSLTTLTITFVKNVTGPPYEHFMPFLARLAFPELQMLRLFLDEEDMTWDAFEFTQFQLRAPNLDELVIKNGSCLTSDALIAVLRNSPSLTALALYNCPHCFDDAVINALRDPGMNGQYIAPKLVTLLLTQVGKNFDTKNLEEMISSRRWTDEELAAFPIPPTVERWAHVLVYAGRRGSYRHFSREFGAQRSYDWVQA